MTTIMAEPVIRADECYPLPVFKKLTGMGAAALREARRKGLPVRRIGLRAFVLGRDFMEFVENHGKLVGPVCQRGNATPPADDKTSGGERMT